ncbi:MAG: hypothetical protein MZV63_40380 [Marinilabiliales bacterium]|nr:hypothetical protein [Marinilabiliales bacterium]
MFRSVTAVTGLLKVMDGTYPQLEMEIRSGRMQPLRKLALREMLSHRS